MASKIGALLMLLKDPAIVEEWAKHIAPDQLTAANKSRIMGEVGAYGYATNPKIKEAQRAEFIRNNASMLDKLKPYSFEENISGPGFYDVLAQRAQLDNPMQDYIDYFIDNSAGFNFKNPYSSRALRQRDKHLEDKVYRFGKYYDNLLDDGRESSDAFDEARDMLDAVIAGDLLRSVKGK